MEEAGFEVDEGVGRPIVFIHGWLGSSNSWGQVRENLELEKTLYFYDQSRLTSSPFSIEELSENLRESLERNRIEEPVIVGHSLGGMTALSYASKYRNLSGLILLATSASTPEPEIESFDFYLENLGTMPREKWAEKISRNYAGHLDNKKLKKQSKQELLQADKSKLKYPLEAMKEFDLRDKFEKYNKPSLVVAGEKDGAITMDKSKELAEILNAKIVKLDCGHLMPWENPEKVAELVKKFQQKATLTEN